MHLSAAAIQSLDWSSVTGRAFLREGLKTLVSAGEVTQRTKAFVTQADSLNSSLKTHRKVEKELIL